MSRSPRLVAVMDADVPTYDDEGGRQRSPEPDVDVRDAPVDANAPRDPSSTAPPRPADEVDSTTITTDDARFLIGAKGATKRKLMRVSGARLEITAIEGDCRLSGLAHLNLARNNLAGDFPFAALDLLVTRCSGGVACKGLPSGSCDAFGGEGDTYYKPRVDDPNKCLRCEGQMKALILIVCACVGMFVMLILYILLILKFKFNLKRWVSTASIFFTHMQTISIFGNLHLHWPPPSC